MVHHLPLDDLAALLLHLLYLVLVVEVGVEFEADVLEIILRVLQLFIIIIGLNLFFNIIKIKAGPILSLELYECVEHLLLFCESGGDAGFEVLDLALEFAGLDEFFEHEVVADVEADEEPHPHLKELPVVHVLRHLHELLVLGLTTHNIYVQPLFFDEGTEESLKVDRHEIIIDALNNVVELPLEPLPVLAPYREGTHVSSSPIVELHSPSHCEIEGADGGALAVLQAVEF